MDEKLQAKKESAQSIRGIPPSEIMVPYPSIRSLLDSQVRRYGDRTFFIIEGKNGREEISFSQFFKRVSQCANYLRRNKIEFGNTVCITSNEPLITLTQFFGVWAVGGTVDLINLSSSIFPSDPTEFENALDGEADIAALGKKSKLADDSLRIDNGNDLTVVLSHYNLIVNGMAIAERFNFSDNDILLCPNPVCELLTLSGGVMTALYAGCRILLTKDGSSDNLSEPVHTAFSCTPTPGSEADETVIPHTSFSGLNHSQITTGFFMPELTGFASFSQTSDEKVTENLIPVGTPLHLCEMTILNNSGEELPNGELGQIAVRGHNVMKGYSNNNKANRKAFAHGWFNTGLTGLSQIGPEEVRSFFVTAP